MGERALLSRTEAFVYPPTRQNLSDAHQRFCEFLSRTKANSISLEKDAACIIMASRLYFIDVTAVGDIVFSQRAPQLSRNNHETKVERDNNLIKLTLRRLCRK